MSDKIIYWEKEVEKVTKPIEKKLRALFKSHQKECLQKKLKTTTEINKLWNDKYKNRYEKYNKQLDEAYKKLWLKYYISSSSTKLKKGYIIK